MSNKTALTALFIFISIDIIIAIWFLSSNKINTSNATQNNSTVQPSVAVVSDIPGITIASYDKQQLLNTLNQLHFFDQQGAKYHTSPTSTNPATVSHLIIHITNKTQPNDVYPLYAALDSSTVGKIYISTEGDLYDPTTKTEDVSIYFNPSILKNLNTTNVNLLLSKFIFGHLWLISSQNTVALASDPYYAQTFHVNVTNQNAFISSAIKTIPLTVKMQ